MKYFVICVLIGLALLVVWLSLVDAKPTTKAQADQAWAAMQADVKTEKAKPTEGTDTEKAAKLKGNEIAQVLAERHGKTLEIELYNNKWKLVTTRYERDSWVAEETTEFIKIGGKKIVKEHKVKIWKQES